MISLKSSNCKISGPDEAPKIAGFVLDMVHFGVQCWRRADHELHPLRVQHPRRFDGDSGVIHPRWPSDDDDSLSAALLENDAPLKDHSQTLTAEVGVDGAHPRVSLVAMIAPSPDWFAGVAGVSLMEGGQYVAEKTVDLYAHDSGGDDGTTYTAADQDNNPKKATSAASPKHFGDKPVARITFRKL